MGRQAGREAGRRAGDARRCAHSPTALPAASPRPGPPGPRRPPRRRPPGRAPLPRTTSPPAPSTSRGWGASRCRASPSGTPPSGSPPARAGPALDPARRPAFRGGQPGTRGPTSPPNAAHDALSWATGCFPQGSGPSNSASLFRGACACALTCACAGVHARARSCVLTCSRVPFPATRCGDSVLLGTGLRLLQPHWQHQFSWGALALRSACRDLQALRSVRSFIRLTRVRGRFHAGGEGPGAQRCGGRPASVRSGQGLPALLCGWMVEFVQTLCLLAAGLLAAMCSHRLCCPGRCSSYFFQVFNKNCQLSIVKIVKF